MISQFSSPTAATGRFVVLVPSRKWDGPEAQLDLNRPFFLAKVTMANMHSVGSNATSSSASRGDSWRFVLEEWFTKLTFRSNGPRLSVNKAMVQEPVRDQMRKLNRWLTDDERAKAVKAWESASGKKCTKWVGAAPIKFIDGVGPMRVAGFVRVSGHGQSRYISESSLRDVVKLPLLNRTQSLGLVERILKGEGREGGAEEDEGEIAGGAPVDESDDDEGVVSDDEGIFVAADAESDGEAGPVSPVRPPRGPVTRATSASQGGLEELQEERRGPRLRVVEDVGLVFREHRISKKHAEVDDTVLDGHL